MVDPAQYESLVLRLLRDDGAVVYLNGVEIFRSNMPENTINYTTRASSGQSGLAQTVRYPAEVPAVLLIAGVNVLAVEVHQASAASSDLRFDLELVGERPIALLPDALPDTTRFAVIGDFGSQAQPAQDVARRVRSWQPELIATTGDNNYDIGSEVTIDHNVGFFYHSFIHPYTGQYGAGAGANRFFPTLGNHDWASEDEVEPYLDYFALPGNERYYEFVRGPRAFFYAG
ncbi:MAG: hypothetical protein HC853_09660 [Anaerolineae bacterium]|nr:hypothetical protein [Anaerolineae bacterium]